MKKFFNIISIIVDMVAEIILLPFHLIKAILSIADELQK